MEIVPTLENWILYFVIFSLSFLLLYLFYHSKFFSTLDVPNHRSMHEYPTKKSAGIVFIGVFIISLSFINFYFKRNITDSMLLLQTVPGLFVCLLIGFLDDRYNFSSRRKLFFEILFFIPYTYFVFPEFSLFGFTSSLPKIFYSIVLSGYLIFVINLCNFMDGLDLYLTLSVFTGFINFFFLLNGISEGHQMILFLLIVCLGSFVFFNFPPARLFMGDTGSLPLGYMIAILPFFSGEKNFDLGYSFLLIPVFWVDGILTILRRILKKENIFHAHREHLYQKITIHSWDKRLTTIIFSFWNLLTIPIYFYFKNSFSILIIALMVIFVNGILYFVLFKKIQKGRVT